MRSRITPNTGTFYAVDILIKNNHTLKNKIQLNLNRRGNLLINKNTDKVKQVSNIRPDCSVSPETSTPKLNIEIVGD